MRETPSVAIVVVTWNGKPYALQCLNSLRNNARLGALTTIVVDNASTDGTPEVIRQEFPEVRLIQSGFNAGFAKANNAGMSVTDAEYLCLINSDVVVPPGCLEALIAYMEMNPDIGMLGPKMRRPDGRVGQSVMLLPTVWNSFCCALGLHSVFKASRKFGGFMMSGFSYDTVTDVEVLTGWFWVLRRSALQEVGGLDERFFMYGEDIDWCYRFHNHGWRVVFYPEAEAIHYEGASSGVAPARFYIEMRRANLQYFRKHHGRRGALGYRLVLWVHELARLAGYGFLYLLKHRDTAALALKVRRSIACLGWLLDAKPSAVK